MHVRISIFISSLLLDVENASFFFFFLRIREYTRFHFSYPWIWTILLRTPPQKIRNLAIFEGTMGGISYDGRGVTL